MFFYLSRQEVIFKDTSCKGNSARRQIVLYSCMRGYSYFILIGHYQPRCQALWFTKEQNSRTCWIVVSFPTVQILELRDPALSVGRKVLLIILCQGSLLKVTENLTLYIFFKSGRRPVHEDWSRSKWMVPSNPRAWQRRISISPENKWEGRKTLFSNS